MGSLSTCIAANVRRTLFTKYQNLVACSLMWPRVAISEGLRHAPAIPAAVNLQQHRSLHKQPKRALSIDTITENYILRGLDAPQFAEGSDPVKLEAELTPLLTLGGGWWSLSSDGAAIERTFKFKTFGKAWDFMGVVAMQCKIKKHHPEWSNTYNTVFIRWTTHSPRGLSSDDLALAAICDILAGEFGELPPAENKTSSSCDLSSDLANRAARAAGGDCCGPSNSKSKSQTAKGAGVDVKTP
ncbi:transcriptional coactivator/pterin dehydratase [Podospora didyma]|uniref:4a-hydroxytetrahydrobiopterin dehydratase n=1 Tax=Podospora didyma TaxID=330526 RepID=A0AAE0NZD6_9PEZI|nr:transcriptional coactivator/pterin dehydratase [Podospora didyma]